MIKKISMRHVSIVFPSILVIINLLNTSLNINGERPQNIPQSLEQAMHYLAHGELGEICLLLYTAGLFFSFYSSLLIENDLWNSLVKGKIKKVHYQFSLITSASFLFFIICLSGLNYKKSTAWCSDNYIWFIYIMTLIITVILNIYFLAKTKK